MMSLAFATIFQASIMATGAHSYEEAYKKANDSGRPLVVMVGTDWCPACVTMKRNVMPKVEQGKAAKKVALAYVNSDQQGALANRLMKGGPIPQLLMFHKTENGWKRERLIGAHSVEEVQTFLSRGASKEAPIVRLSSRPTVKAAK